MFDNCESLWPTVPVVETLERKRGREVRKLQTSEYQLSGALPIIDQGADFICGYTDRIEAAYPYDLPVIVFGDHTRILKYVDFPFVVGADGTQCLHPRPGIDARFYYYSLCNVDLSSEGYARHFKLLKEKRIVLPPLDEQRRIAEVLLSVDAARQANLDTLQQAIRARAAILSATFEDAPWEPVRLAELGRWQSGGTPSKEVSSYWGGDVPWVCPRDMKVPIVSKSLDYITRDALGGSCKLVPMGTLLLVVRGMILAKAIPTALSGVETTYNQDMKAFRPNGRATARFVRLCLQHQETELLKVVNTATHGTKKLDQATIDEILVPLPDLETQETISEMISRLDSATVSYGAEHIRLSELRKNLIADLVSGRVRVPA